MTWDPVRRQFASSTNSTEKDFLVVKTHQILEKLTPTTADLRFGAQFAGLPRLNLAALVADEDEAANQIIQHLPGGAGSAIASATKALEALLNGRSDVLLNAAVDAAVDGYLDQMFQPGGPLNAVTNAAAAQAALTGTANTLRTNLAGLIGGASDAGKVLGEIKAALDKLEAGLAAADVILQKDGTGARGTFLTATVSIGGTTGQSAAAKINTLINTDLRETLDEIQSRVSDLHRAVTQVNGQLTSIQSLLTNALAGVNGGGAADLPATAVAAMQNYFATASDPAGRYLAELGPAKIRADLKQLVRDQVHASPFVADLQRTLRDQLQPLRDEFNLAFERMHGVINDVLRAAFSELGNALAGPLGEESKINRAVGTFSSTLQLAKIEGTARIEGDTLVSAHLGAELGLQVPDRVGISGWIDYHNYKSGQPTPRCAGVVGADGRVEITVGAEGGASIQGNPPVHAKLVGRYAMTATGAPLAASGELLFETDIKFDQMTLKQVHFKFAFGEHDNYLFAQGASSIGFSTQTCAPSSGRHAIPRCWRPWTRGSARCSTCSSLEPSPTPTPSRAFIGMATAKARSTASSASRTRNSSASAARAGTVIFPSSINRSLLLVCRPRTQNSSSASARATGPACRWRSSRRRRNWCCSVRLTRCRWSGTSPADSRKCRRASSPGVACCRSW